MAKIKNNQSYNNGPIKRVSPLKPGLRGAKNWTASKVRAASHSKKSFLQFCMGVLAVFLAITIVALWLGGFWPQIIQNSKIYKQNRLMDLGFVVERVDVMGEGRLNEQDVLRAVNIRPGDYFFGVDLKQAQRRTESLPWVERAVVRRLWPNRIVVQLVEAQPYALWQKEGKLALINDVGDVISPVFDASSVPQGLIHVVGEGAHREVAGLEDSLKEWPDIQRRVRSAIYVSERRWDLILEGDVKVKLPSQKVDTALSNLSSLQSETQILDRKVSAIDLRLSDRISIHPLESEQA